MSRAKQDARTRRENLRLLREKGLTEEYWEETLRRDGLSMDAGRTTRLTFVGTLDNLESVYEENVRHKLGDVASGTSDD